MIVAVSRAVSYKAVIWIHEETTMLCSKYISFVGKLARILCLSAILSSALCARSLAQSPPDETATLVAVLTSGAPVFDKAEACRRLAVMGDQSAVPALAALLTDEKLSSHARCALEGIPGPAPDAALREALSRLSDERLIGVLKSIGARRDTEAVGSVARLLHGDDSDDDARFRLALQAARRLGADGRLKVSTELAMQLDRQPPARQALLLIALCDLGDKSVLPAVVAAAGSDNAEVRVEAIHALGRLGDASVAPVLFEAATQSDRRIADAARSTLATPRSGRPRSVRSVPRPGSRTYPTS